VFSPSVDLRENGAADTAHLASMREKRSMRKYHFWIAPIPIFYQTGDSTHYNDRPSVRMRDEYRGCQNEQSATRAIRQRVATGVLPTHAPGRETSSVQPKRRGFDATRARIERSQARSAPGFCEPRRRLERGR
jgi:hypothetical protein